MPAVHSEQAVLPMPAGQTPRPPAVDFEAEAGPHLPPGRTLVGELIWEAFTGLDEQDRSIWLQSIWEGRCLCSVARDMGLSAQEVRASLHITAHHLDAVGKLVLSWSGVGVATRTAAAASHAAGGGACAKQLALHLRRLVRVRCDCSDLRPPDRLLRSTHYLVAA